MHEGWEYVAATYGITAITIGVWFWMILTKLRRVTRDRSGSGEPPRG